MTTPKQRLAPTPVRRWYALLVFGLLAGLLAMHALAPGGAVREHAAPQHTRAVVVSAHEHCTADHGGCDGGHLHHADPTCAAASVSGAPTLAPLVPDPVAVPVRTDAPRSCATRGPGEARAPPSLAELQLLRI
ncbi:DUF6153 family protein [Streptomyces sp. P3]|uniref:DUF6153 family protein n=1 Tax=Streptomyces sp. P3 TaxID=2135430 RepID=UPI0015718E54|nr:DUF6153 family protein [Streptomyces sp. P3]